MHVRVSQLLCQIFRTCLGTLVGAGPEGFAVFSTKQNEDGRSKLKDVLGLPIMLQCLDIALVGTHLVYLDHNVS